MVSLHLKCAAWLNQFRCQCVHGIIMAGKLLCTSSGLLTFAYPLSIVVMVWACDSSTTVLFFWILCTEVNLCMLLWEDFSAILSACFIVFLDEFPWPDRGKRASRHLGRLHAVVWGPYQILVILRFVLKITITKYCLSYPSFMSPHHPVSAFAFYCLLTSQWKGCSFLNSFVVMSFHGSFPKWLVDTS